MEHLHSRPMIGRPARAVKPEPERRGLGLAAMVAGLVTAAPAQACDCRRLPEPSPAIATDARFIFASRVVEIHERSVTGTSFTVATDWSDCSYPFEVGAQYLVFADASGRARPSTSICMRTTPLDRAAPVEIPEPRAVIFLLEAAVVLGFPACAVWALRTGGAPPSAHARTTLMTLLLGGLLVGLPMLAGALTVRTARRRLTHALGLYLLGAAAAFIALLIGTSLAAHRLPRLA